MVQGAQITLVAEALAGNEEGTHAPKNSQSLIRRLRDRNYDEAPRSVTLSGRTKRIPKKLDVNLGRRSSRHVSTARIILAAVPTLQRACAG